MSKTQVLMTALIMVASASAEAKTLYVNAATGNDSQTYAGNSASAPWRSLGRAVWGSTDRNSPNPDEAARAGDTVTVAAGTYTTTGTESRYQPAYNPANSGTSGNPIVFAAEGVVTLRLSSSGGPVIGAYLRHYITWRGFTINEANAPSRPDTGSVVIWEANDTTIEGCIIDGNGDPGYGDNHTGIRLGAARRAVIRNNRISNVRTSGVNVANGSAIQVYHSGDVVIENNELTDSGSGVFLKALADEQAGFGWVDQFTIRYNRIARVGVGVAVHRSPTTAARPTRIYQNIVTDSGQAIRLWGFDLGATDPRNTKIVNNTLHNNRESFSVSDLVDNAGHIFWNNIVTNSTDFAVNVTGQASALTRSRLDMQHNAYWVFGRFGIVYTTQYASLASWKTATGQDSVNTASVDVDPLYTNAGQGDFRPQAAPVRLGGIDVLDLDRDGSTTDVVPMGAYVTGAEIIGRLTGGAPLPPASGAPAAPTGLRILSSQ